MSSQRQLDRVTSDAEIRQVKQFLYRIYEDEMGWTPPPGNPSLWVVEGKDSQHPWYSDFFDTHSQWFCLKENSEIIASCRIIRKKERKLEYELYRKPNPNIAKQENAVELNRLAIRKEFLNSTAAIELLLGVLEWCMEEKVSSILIPVPPALLGICTKLGFTEIDQEYFRYSSLDSGQIHMLALEIEDAAFAESIHRQWRNIS